MKIDTDALCESGYEETVLIDDFDDAFLGISTAGCAVYSYSKMITVLMNDGCTDVEAMEYLEYNVIGSLAMFGERSPVILMEDENWTTS